VKAVKADNGEKQAWNIFTGINPGRGSERIALNVE